MARRLYVDEREQSVDLLAVDGKGMALVLPEEWAKEREVVVIHAHAGREPQALRDSVDVHNVLLVEIQQAEGHVKQDAEQDEAHVPKHPNGHALCLEDKEG